MEEFTKKLEKFLAKQDIDEKTQKKIVKKVLKLLEDIDLTCCAPVEHDCC